MSSPVGEGLTLWAAEGTSTGLEGSRVTGVVRLGGVRLQPKRKQRSLLLLQDQSMHLHTRDVFTRVILPC